MLEIYDLISHCPLCPEGGSGNGSDLLGPDDSGVPCEWLNLEMCG